MELIDPGICVYCDDWSSAEPEHLKALNRFTHANVLQPRMLSGHYQGRLLSLISKMIRPQRILEIGSYTGYSALCLAEGLSTGGKLTTIEVNPELEQVIRKHFSDAGMQSRIELLIGDATQLIPTMDELFDLVFIDADKPNYLNYFNLVFPKLKIGGFILADNVLWSGKVLNPRDLEKDKDTKAIHAFNETIKNDSRVENVLLPIRDGINLIRKLRD